jgi:hypothetical protein
LPAGRQRLCRVGQGDVLAAQRFQLLLVLRRGDGGDQQRPALVGLADLLDGDPVRQPASSLK